jgi:hypothetical protein
LFTRISQATPRKVKPSAVAISAQTVENTAQIFCADFAEDFSLLAHNKPSNNRKQDRVRCSLFLHPVPCDPNPFGWKILRFNSFFSRIYKK